MGLALGVLTGFVLLGLGLARAATAPPGAPAYIAPYHSWLKINKKPIPNSPTTAHPASVKDVFVNVKKFPRTANIRLPYGTIVVKEGRAKDGTVTLLAVMRKMKGADPKHNDWVWKEYTRASATDRFSLTASGAVCWGCHQAVAAHDYIWTKR